MGLVLRSAELEIIKKAVFSKPQDTTVKKSVLTPKNISGKNILQLEIFTADNKAKHRNIGLDDTAELEKIITEYSQINLYTTLGECELKTSKSGNETLIGGDKLQRAIDGANDIGIDPINRIAPVSNNKKKN